MAEQVVSSADAREATAARDDAPQCSEEAPAYAPSAVEFAAGAG